MDIEFLISIAKANNSRDIISLYSLKNIRFSMGEIDQNPGLDGGSKNHIFTTFAYLFISHLCPRRPNKQRTRLNLLLHLRVRIQTTHCCKFVSLSSQ